MADGGDESPELGVEDEIPYAQDLDNWDWGAEYLKCPIFHGFWQSTHTHGAEWPKGFILREGKLFYEGKICVPWRLQRPWIRDQHTYHGHVGAERLWYHFIPSVEFADTKLAQKYTFKVMGECETCQACTRARRLAGPMEYTPVPTRVMYHVCLDLFRLPPVIHEGRTYDTLAVCVDRNSGWIIAVPCLDKGLTGSQLAQIMLREWRPFGIPSVVTSDRGSHFTGAWWRTCCAELGIKHAYAHAYHHQSNGRAEVAGQQIKEVLRKILVEENLTWVEALPRVLDKIHDAKGVGGLSPYEIMFGRYRPFANKPYETEKDCEDAISFFNRMKDTDERISRILNEMHDQRMVWDNSHVKKS